MTTTCASCCVRSSRCRTASVWRWARSRILVAHQSEALRCDLALIDVNLGADLPNGLDAFAWLRAHDFQGRVVFLTGHARTHPLVERAHDLDGVPVLEKPVTLDTLLALLNDSPRE